MATLDRYPVDPPSIRAQSGLCLPFTIFDVPRLMSFMRAGLVEGVPPLEGVGGPTDDQLIATMIALGMPKWSSDQMRYNPMLRLQYYMVWLDVREAAKGIKESKERIDSIRATYAQMRIDELVADIPNKSVGFWER